LLCVLAFLAWLAWLLGAEAFRSCPHVAPLSVVLFDQLHYCILDLLLPNDIGVALGVFIVVVFVLILVVLLQG
jgi:hypothetical protein